MFSTTGKMMPLRMLKDDGLNVLNGYLKSCQRLHQLSIEQHNPIDIHANDERTFRFSC